MSTKQRLRSLSSHPTCPPHFSPSPRPRHHLPTAAFFPLNRPGPALSAAAAGPHSSRLPSHLSRRSCLLLPSGEAGHAIGLGAVGSAASSAGGGAGGGSRNALLGYFGVATGGLLGMGDDGCSDVHGGGCIGGGGGFVGDVGGGCGVGGDGGGDDGVSGDGDGDGGFGGDCGCDDGVGSDGGVGGDGGGGGGDGFGGIGEVFDVDFGRGLRCSLGGDDVRGGGGSTDFVLGGGIEGDMGGAGGIVVDRGFFIGVDEGVLGGGGGAVGGCGGGGGGACRSSVFGCGIGSNGGGGGVGALWEAGLGLRGRSPRFPRHAFARHAASSRATPLRPPQRYSFADSVDGVDITPPLSWSSSSSTPCSNLWRALVDAVALVALVVGDSCRMVGCVPPGGESPPPVPSGLAPHHLPRWRLYLRYLSALVLLVAV